MSKCNRSKCNRSDIFFICCFPFLCRISFTVVVLDRFFFLLGTKNVVAGHMRQVVVLYSNNCMRTGLGGLSIGHLGEWSSYRGGRVSRFDCTSFTSF